MEDVLVLHAQSDIETTLECDTLSPPSLSLRLLETFFDYAQFCSNFSHNVIKNL